jgi:hypothetical protein
MVTTTPCASELPRFSRTLHRVNRDRPPVTLALLCCTPLMICVVPAHVLSSLRTWVRDRVIVGKDEVVAKVSSLLEKTDLSMYLL